MTISEMIQKKKESGFSYEDLSALSGVPASTIQKVLGGATSSPRRTTIEALSKAFAILSDIPHKITSEIPLERPAGTQRRILYNKLGKYDAEPGYEAESEEENGYICEDSPKYDAFNGSNALDTSSYTDKTIEDYLALPDDVRVELIDGVFYDMAGPNNIHQIISGTIYSHFLQYVDSNGGSCIPMISPADVQLDCDDKTMVQPDVFVVCDRDKFTLQRLVGAPDLVIEVLSPSNWYHDMVRKLRKYRNAGVREYWIVIPGSLKVLVYFFEKSIDPYEYTFNDVVPVNIWDGKCSIDFREIYNRISFLM